MSTQNEERLVYYSQNSTRKGIPEDQAIYMIEQIAQQDIQRGLVYFQKLTDDNPNAGQLRWHFYEKLLSLYMFDELLELTNQRLSQTPDCAIAFSWKLDALQHMFRNHDAIAMLRDACLKDPMDYNALNMLGTFYKDVGDFKSALESFDLAIKINPHYAPPYWHRSDISGDPEADYAAVTAQISAGVVDQSRAHFLQFSAYRHAEQLEQRQTAFEHLSFANGLKRHTLNFDVETELAVDQKAIDVFSSERLKHFTSEGVTPGDTQPIFILGMPRSGTTLVEQIIASHSSVAAADEYTALANAIQRCQTMSQYQGPMEEWLSTRNHQDWAKIGNAYLDNMRYVRGNKRVFTDKNQFNHRSVGVIRAALPHAKIIWVERQAMDVLFGCYRQLFGSNGAPFSYQYDELITMYRSYTQLMEYWYEQLDGMILRVHYEELVNTPNTIIDQILQFCGLPHQQACYDFHTTRRAVKTLSGGQVRKPIFTHGIDRWKQYQNQLGDLADAAGQAGIL